MLRGSEYILKKISLLGVKKIFSIPGAHIDPLLFAAAESDIEVIINCHELSSGYMADGFSRSNDKIGVCIAIGGPGSNNLVTAVNTARLEKVPLLVITGDVPNGFSHVPSFQCSNGLGTKDFEIFKHITKYSKRVKTIEDLVIYLDEAINSALSPPFGPSHLIIPFCVFNDTTQELPTVTSFEKLRITKSENSETTIARITNLLFSDKKLIFWIGDSLNKPDIAENIFLLAKKFHIPVATTYSAKGVFPEDDYLALGNFGYAGSLKSKEILLSNEPDVIIGFDVEQNERNTMCWYPDLYKEKQLILVNYPGSFSDLKYGESIEDNPFYILQSLGNSIRNSDYDNSQRKDWFSAVLQSITKNINHSPLKRNGLVEPGTLVKILNKELPEKSMLFVDSGNHRIYPGLHWKAAEAGMFFSASTTAPLGWAIAAGIGAKFNRSEPVIIFTGDGCMQMHGVEIKTAVKHKLPILVIVLNNSAFGSIYKRAKKVSEKAARMFTIEEIDWVMFAKSFGAEAHNISSEQTFIKHIRLFLEHQKLTVLIVKTPVDPFIHDPSQVKSAFI